MMNKPYSEACEENREPILKVIRPLLARVEHLLEIGSGTGQHAVYFAPEFPELRWQTSDRVENHAGIQQWLDEAQAPNILPPIALNVATDAWPEQKYGVVYSANTTHIMSWEEVELMFAGIGKVLRGGGLFILYGPFNYNGDYSSDSNRRFDAWLKERDPKSGIRDFADLNALAEKHRLAFLDDIAMPVNNRTLVWQKD